MVIERIYAIFVANKDIKLRIQNDKEVYLYK